MGVILFTDALIDGEELFFSFYFYRFGLTNECFMDIIHLSIFLKFTEDLDFPTGQSLGFYCRGV